ncbi:kinase-like domain-containing protein [Coprinopsis sp. MPI-PUGE-AT-0042]|nr:kinase-like domain-containing protein [Coprinopsis sp. MPI-PUGE-AT-0042]
MSAILQGAKRLLSRPWKPIKYPTSGFEILQNSQRIEEETWDWYTPDEFYPAEVGEVLKSQYQIVGKLGLGSYGTAWLCRDLTKRRHVTVKIGTKDAMTKEMALLRHIAGVKSELMGQRFIRQALDTFALQNGKFQCIIHPPMAETLEYFRRVTPDAATNSFFVKAVTIHMLHAIDFLHRDAKVVHTDIHESNIMLSMDEATVGQRFAEFEQAEVVSPSPRKVLEGRVVHVSRALVPRGGPYGRPVLCDFGEARFGGYDPRIDIQPFAYRAPEVIHNIPWDEKVDIWSIGVLLWDVSRSGNLFQTLNTEGIEDAAHHVADMIALIGPPPLEFVQRARDSHPKSRAFTWFDEQGEWKGPAEIPTHTLEAIVPEIHRDEKDLFLSFVRRILKWLPEERPTAQELLQDPWLKS